MIYLQIPRKSLYSRYSTGDWTRSNDNHFKLSEHERSLGESLRADAWRAVKATDQRTRNRQASNTKKLGKQPIKIVRLLSEKLVKFGLDFK